MDALLTEKAHRQQSELSWLRETDTKISMRGFLEIMDKLDKVRGIGVGGLELPSEISARAQQMVREGLPSPRKPSSRWASNRALLS
jgi:hypothetical protein